MRTVLGFALVVGALLLAGVRPETGLAQESDGARVTAPGASASDGAATAPARVQSTSLGQIFRSGGRLMYVLAALSFATVALVIYLLVVLRVPQVAPPLLLRELCEKIRMGAFDDASRAAEYNPCPLSSVAIAGMSYVREASEPDPILLKDIVEGEGVRQAEAIQGQTQYLLDIAVVAPMVGLLGTVIGMYTAFGAVAVDIASAKPVVLAAGVQLALITTVYGLIVAIPSMICYAVFRRRASSLVSHLETASTEVLTALLSKR